MSRVSVQGVKSLGSHFACLCRGFEFYEVKKNVILFQKENGNTFILLSFLLWKVFKKSKIAQVSTPRRLTLVKPEKNQQIKQNKTKNSCLNFTIWHSCNISNFFQISCQTRKLTYFLMAIQLLVRTEKLWKPIVPVLWFKAKVWI